MSYKIIAKGEKRSFSIITGLRDDKSNITFNLEDVVDIHHSWQEEKKQILGVLIEEIVICWGQNHDDMIFSFRESGCRISGEINVQYMNNLDHTSISILVMSLAKELGAELNQERVYVNIMDTSYILERE